MGRLTAEQYRQSAKLPLVVVLDDIRSMYNVGSVFRTADAFRVARLCLCGITSRPPHREIHKTALGAEDSVPWEHHATAAEAVRALQAEGFTVLAIEQAHGSTMLHDFHPDPAGRYAIVLGNEVHGVSQEAVDAADTVVEIPQWGTKHSMNVSVAAGIVMYELQKGMRTAATAQHITPRS